MDSLLSLADRCEAATGPDIQLDADIRDAIGLGNDYSADWRGWGIGDDGQPIEKPKAFPYTSSLDAAMTLVPEGRILRNYTVSRFVPHTCEVAVDYAHGGWIGHSDHSFALALCAAALKARASQ